MREVGFPEIVDLAKSLKIHFSVIPANPGSSPGQALESSPARSGIEKLINTLGSGFHPSDDSLQDHQKNFGTPLVFPLPDKE